MSARGHVLKCSDLAYRVCLFRRKPTRERRSRFCQLGATSGLYVEGQKPSRRVQQARRLVPRNGFWEGTMKLPRRKFLHLAAGAAALPAVLRAGASLSVAAGAHYCSIPRWGRG
jgi:hypothetical protein